MRKELESVANKADVALAAQKEAAMLSKNCLSQLVNDYALFQ